jgi:hypothetical protein
MLNSQNRSRSLIESTQDSHREETRMHVHIGHTDGEAKYWLEPSISLAQNVGLSAQQLRHAEQLVNTYEHRIRTAWNEHFRN